MPPSGDTERSSLEELRERLYAQEAPTVPAPTPVAAPTPPVPVENVAPVWTPPAPPPPKKKVSWSFVFLIAAAVTFVIALLVAGYFLVFGTRAISSDRVDITVEPTPSLKSGEVATLLITVKNGNPTAIHHTNLSATFPDSARDPNNPLNPYPRSDDTLGDIPAGESRTASIRVALSGAEGQTYQIPLKLEYRTEGSNAVFVKNVSHDVTISSSPLSVKVVLPPDAALGQELSMEVTVHSDAPAPVENVAVLSDSYPSGFIPAADTKGLVDIGTLAPGSEKTVTIKGTLVGDDTSDRVFRFKAGTKGDNGTLALVYASGQAQIAIRKPFLDTRLTVNGSTDANYVVSAGKQVTVGLSWANTLASTLTDAQIEVQVTGGGVDTKSINAQTGFFRSADSTVIFAPDTTPGLSRVEPGDAGVGSFTFMTKPATALKSVRDPSITITVKVTGRTNDGTNGPKQVTATMVRTVQLATDLALKAQSVRTVGGIKNTGPWPPVPDKETTYTVLFTFSNTVNAVAGASVTAKLPSYVRYTGTTVPSDGSVTYDAVTRTVTWAAGDVPAQGTGAKQAAFQVALLPSLSQRGTSPILVTQISYAGTDRVTKRAVEGTTYEVTTEATADPQYQSSFGQVVR